MTITNPESAARQLQQAQQQSRQIEPIAARLPGFDLTAGYAMADLLHRERVQQGAVAAGRKIGFTNPAMLARYGVEQPVWGYTCTNILWCMSGMARHASASAI